MHRRRWYPRLNSDHSNGLLKYAVPTADSLIICQQGEEYRSFSMFNPLYTFCNHILQQKVEDRCFYEVILGDRPQKPYFDIDIDDPNLTEEDGRKLISVLVSSIKEDSRIKDADILVFNSHGQDKLSYHVVINNWCLPDVGSNKIYCHRIIDRISDDFYMKKFIDSLVYKSIQQFRTYGSTKKGKDRFKKLDGIILPNPNDKNYRFNFITTLLSSLVSNTNSCRVLEYKTPEPKKWLTDIQDLNLEEIKTLETLECIDDGTFSILEPKGRLIPLKRNRPSYCQPCDREHENENPYLTVSSDGSKIYFHCRRSKNDRFVIWEKTFPDLVPVIGKKIMKDFFGKR